MSRIRRKNSNAEVAFGVAGMMSILTFVWIAPLLLRQIGSWIEAEQSATSAGMSYSTPLDYFPFLVTLTNSGGMGFLIITSMLAFVCVYAMLRLLLRSKSDSPRRPEERLRADFTATTPFSLVDEEAKYIPAWQLSPREFEYEVARIIEITTGRTAQVVGGAGDNGVDIRVMNGRQLVGVVQCKRYHRDKALPPQFVRELAAVKQKYQVSIAYLVTSSYFSSQCQAEAAHYGIKLMDGSQLEELRQREYRREIERIRRQ